MNFKDIFTQMKPEYLTNRKISKVRQKDFMNLAIEANKIDASKSISEYYLMYLNKFKDKIYAKSKERRQKRNQEHGDTWGKCMR